MMNYCKPYGNIKERKKKDGRGDGYVVDNKNKT